jgi:hypothetical protein
MATTAILDALTTLLNGSLIHVLTRVVPKFLKSIFNRKYNAEMLEDLRALGFTVEQGLESSAGRFSNG